MSQDTLKVRVVINQGGENQSDLEAPLKPVSGVEQAQVIRALQSGKMNETSDAYTVDEKYTYNYKRIFGVFFLMVAFFVAATSYFIGRTQPHIQTEKSQQSTSPLDVTSSVATGDQSAEVVTAMPVEAVTAIPANEKANQAATPVSSLQLVESLAKIGGAETASSVPMPAVMPSVTPQGEKVSSSMAMLDAIPTHVANISSLQTRILESTLVMNPTFLGSMIKKEPGVPLASQLPFDENHLIRVFFYVETKNLKGKWLRQHWYYQDKKMATVTAFINSNAFKTHSSKFIRYNWAGDWQVVVSVVDQPNQIETKEKKLVEGQLSISVEPSE